MLPWSIKVGLLTARFVRFSSRRGLRLVVARSFCTPFLITPSCVKSYFWSIALRLLFLILLNSIHAMVEATELFPRLKFILEKTKTCPCNYLLALTIFFFLIESISILAIIQFYHFFQFINVSIVLSMSFDKIQCFSSPMKQTTASSFRDSSLNANFLVFHSL